MIFGKIADMFGKKVTFILLVIPHLTFWLLILTSTHVYQLYIARVCAGLTGGGTLRTISLFITEISENHIRGQLGSYLMLFLSAGTLIVFIAGTYLSFFTVPLVMMIFPTIFLISVLFLPDTPASLMSRNKPELAWESLKFYRSCGKNKAVAEKFKDEFELLRKASEQKDYEKLKMSDFCKYLHNLKLCNSKVTVFLVTKSAKKGIIIGVFLMFLNQFSGTFAFMTYTADIFNSSGSNFTPNESSIIVALIQLIGVYFSMSCVERFGRKVC